MPSGMPSGMPSPPLSGVGHIVALYPATGSYEEMQSAGGYLATSGWELLHMDSKDDDALPPSQQGHHLSMGVRRWNVATCQCWGYLVCTEDGMGCTTSTEDEAGTSPLAIWETCRYGGGTVTFACTMGGGQRRYIELVSNSDAGGGYTLALATSISERCYIRVHTLCPPTVNLAPLCSLYLLDGVDSDAEFTDYEERVCTQALMDAAQQTGYFFISGVEGLELMAAEVLDHIRCGYSSSSHRDEFHKCTLFTSTGRVKASSIPERYEPVILPPWVVQQEGGRDVGELFEAYFARVMKIAHMLLEALLQREFKGDGRGSNVEGDSDPQSDKSGVDLYGMMRGVCYPPGVASDTTFGPHHGSLEEHTDKTWITILAATTLEGLEFTDIDGSKSTVRSVEDLLSPNKRPPRLLVNIGDAMQTYTGGAFVSRPHRARNVGSLGPRISLPLFVEPAPGHWPTAASAAQAGAVRTTAVSLL